MASSTRKRVALFDNVAVGALRDREAGRPTFPVGVFLTVLCAMSSAGDATDLHWGINCGQTSEFPFLEPQKREFTCLTTINLRSRPAPDSVNMPPQNR